MIKDIDNLLDDIFKTEEDRKVLYDLLEIARESDDYVKKLIIYKKTIYGILSPQLRDLLDSIIRLERLMDRVRIEMSHDLLPTMEEISEILVLADKVRSYILHFVRTRIRDEGIKVKIEQEFKEYRKILQKVKEQARPFAKYKDKPSELYSLITEFVQFVRIYVVPLFDEIVQIYIFKPEVIFEKVESMFAKNFVNRFLPAPPTEEER